ncbi:LacI family DNA-binding transcriptional regulator [Planococcus sp. CPCC 101016]|uniref:LacI family DNA-binding transcriptional regulator n=1 Tax=Planococcus sp. CPCC 101016 TaxID=2599617 RepID=UPI0011B70A45|nr:substrate-binding domain-containing protein [Planococcus sp. CPCC 101016]TWT04386.1 LacI family DNA-binding transcriptional regulator [Planococcus sp. CPCC 101016]
MKKITMQDVALKAGVSKSTVSQYINNRFEFMAVPTKHRVEAAIKELGYIPNQVAKSLKQKKTGTIGVIVANILHTFSTEIIRAIEDECERNSFHLFVCNADDQPDKERSYIDMLVAKQVDGLIIFPTNGNNDYYKQLKNAEFPIVFVDRVINEPIFPTLLLDNESASQIAVDQLAKKGRKKIGLVSTSIAQNVTPRIERIIGFKRALASHGLAVEEDWIVAAERQLISNRLQGLWESTNRPEAFFATNDLALIELLKFIKKNKLSIPEDIGVIAIDDSPFLEMATTPISVIKQPTFEIGHHAAETLLKLIVSKDFKEEYAEQRYRPILVERESI